MWVSCDYSNSDLAVYWSLPWLQLDFQEGHVSDTSRCSFKDDESLFNPPICRNVVPYSCYELASMLLEQDPSSPEGIKLLEQCVVYPPHEFQGRLKLVVGELFKRYRGSSTTVESCVNTQQGSIKTVSGQLKAKFSI